MNTYIIPYSAIVSTVIKQKNEKIPKKIIPSMNTCSNVKSFLLDLALIDNVDHKIAVFVGIPKAY